MPSLVMKWSSGIEVTLKQVGWIGLTKKRQKAFDCWSSRVFLFKCNRPID